MVFDATFYSKHPVKSTWSEIKGAFCQHFFITNTSQHTATFLMHLWVTGDSAKL